MPVFHRYCLLFFYIIYPCCIHQDLVQAEQNQAMILTIPAQALHKTISDMLPLPLEQTGDRFQGTITVDSISALEINNNLISIQGQISGRDMQLTTNIGGQDIRLKLGRLVLPITCDISLRFDPKKKTLFLTPRFQNPTHGHSNSAKTLLPLLNALGNREYPLPLDTLQPLTGKIGQTTISITMEPVNIRAGHNEIILEFRTIAKKISK
jgi:hypothetical protein